MALDKWIYAFLAGRYLAAINNRTLKELVEKMAPQLAASSIRDYLGIIKSVMASAINENGEELFPRKWNEEYSDAPGIDDQRQPTATSEGVTAAKAAGTVSSALLLLAAVGLFGSGKPLVSRSTSISSGLPNAAHHPKGQAWCYPTVS
jgi:hypothetical protein